MYEGVLGRALVKVQPAENGPRNHDLAMKGASAEAQHTSEEAKSRPSVPKGQNACPCNRADIPDVA